MLSLISHTNDIYFNLASEEYLLREKDQDCFMLWQSGPCIVVGKHQNALAEINQPFVAEKGIPVARRLSGGGTVYHDMGNLNFSVIQKRQAGKLVDFAYFVSPIIEYLRALGVHVTMGAKNELLIRDLKISGNAEHVYKDRVLHHGTLLFNADLEELNKSVQVLEEKYVDKAVKSNRSAVTNISEHLPQTMNMEEFMAGLFRHLQGTYPYASSYRFSSSERERIMQLRNEKYATEAWIFGYSPEFKVSGNISFGGAQIDLHGRIKKGILYACDFSMESSSEMKAVKAAILNKTFCYSMLKKEMNLDPNIPADLRDAILEVLFYKKGS